MSFYCPECGTEVTDGVKCPSCDHMDEECTQCGSHVGNNTWYCANCDTPRTHCPDCGKQLDDEGCPHCGSERPPVCESCSTRVSEDAVVCDSCGYNPGKKLRSRATKTRYVGYGLFVLFTISGWASQITQGSLNGETATVVGMINASFLIVLVLPTYLLARRWEKKSNSKTVGTVPT